MKLPSRRALRTTVAPRGGAGIEIEEKTECGMTLLVAPRGEAGIEILNGIHSVTSGSSPLAEGRELKYVGHQRRDFRLWSPLAEGRELKFVASLANAGSTRSPLAEGRELK